LIVVDASVNQKYGLVRIQVFENQRLEDPGNTRRSRDSVAESDLLVARWSLIVVHSS